MYVYTYTYDQRLSTTSLWVLKCGLKLEGCPHEFQIYTIMVFFSIFVLKVCIFFSHFFSFFSKRHYNGAFFNYRAESLYFFNFFSNLENNGDFFHFRAESLYFF